MAGRHRRQWDSDYLQETANIWAPGMVRWVHDCANLSHHHPKPSVFADSYVTVGLADGTKGGRVECQTRRLFVEFCRGAALWRAEAKRVKEDGRTEDEELALPPRPQE